MQSCKQNKIMKSGKHTSKDIELIFLTNLVNNENPNLKTNADSTIDITFAAN